MLVVGAGGLLLQMLDDLLNQYSNGLTCWADRPVENGIVKEKCRIISSDEEIKNYFTLHGNDFVIATGNPATRNSLTKKFEQLGGVPVSFISPGSIVSSLAVIGNGSVILHGSIVEAGCVVGNSVLINSNTTITHEATIGEYTEIGPGVTIAGKVAIGNECFIGAGVTIKPGISIGDKAVAGAGSVIIRDIIKEDIVAGVPAKSIRK